MGYGGCEAGSLFKHLVVYKSNDSSCNVVEYENDDTGLVPCSYWSSPEIGSCMNSGGLDYGTNSVITGVFCTK